MRSTGNKLIISNRDRNGARLRPSNWHERLADIAAELEGGRLIYDSKVKPCMICPNRICVVVDRSIRQTKPYVLDTIESFMRINELTPYAEPCPQQPHVQRDKVAKRGLNLVAA